MKKQKDKNKKVLRYTKYTQPSFRVVSANPVLHICTESPCPIQEMEIARMLDSGFTTSFTDEKNPT